MRKSGAKVSQRDAPLHAMRVIYPGESAGALEREWAAQPASHWCEWLADEKARELRARSPNLRAHIAFRAYALERMCRWAKRAR